MRLAVPRPDVAPPPLGGLDAAGGPWRVLEAAGPQAAALLYAMQPPAPRALLLPLVVRDHTVGVLRVASAGGVLLSPEQARLLVALAYYAALGVERVRLVETPERAEAERRRGGAAKRAAHGGVARPAHAADDHQGDRARDVARRPAGARARSIEEEADRLDALVGDLLDLSRIQAGAVRPDVAVNTADDLLGAALQRAAGALRGREVRVDLPTDALLAAAVSTSRRRCAWW